MKSIYLICSPYWFGSKPLLKQHLCCSISQLDFILFFKISWLIFSAIIV